VFVAERGDDERWLLLEGYDHHQPPTCTPSVASFQRERAEQSRERPIDGVGLLVTRLVVRVDLRRLRVGVLDMRVIWRLCQGTRCGLRR
jgi:hypothetical protein